MFLTSKEQDHAEAVQALLNRGLFYTLTKKKNGEVVGHFHTTAEAMRAKTRKTRIVLTQHLLINQVLNDGEKQSSTTCE